MAGLDAKMDNIVHNYLPDYWHQMHVDDRCHPYALKKDSIKYQQLQSKMQGGFFKHITGIYQLQNPILYNQFQLKVAESALSGNVTVRELLHCTAAKNVKSILENNFDWRLSNRVKYGHGVSFAVKPDYAHMQSSLKNGTARAMIVADVIIGNTQFGNQHTIIPDEPYDTTISKDNNVIVKYCDNEFYPKYVIYYEGYGVGTKNGHRYLKR